MVKSSVALLAASVLALQAQAQTYTASVITAPSAAPAAATYTVTQDTGADVPLFKKVFDYPYLPYKADSGDGPRGSMQGYNICNSTTVGPESMCATAFLNSIEDFCLWGAPALPDEEDEVVANIEGEMVAYCTTPRHGARVIPEGALKGVQFIKTPDYVEVIGMIDQSALKVQEDDSGGEEDPHGADMRGNPLGSLFYTSAFGPGPSSAYKQVHEWHYFLGGGVFCLKVCDPASAQGPELCQHIYDRIGCAYNAPADYAAVNGTFSSCQGDNQLPPGIYVEDGKTMTYTQPPESLGAIQTIPYVAEVPATSQCSTYQSSAIFTELAKASAAISAASSAASGVASGASASGGAATSGNAQAAARSSARPSATETSSASRVLASSALALLATVGLYVLA